MVPGSDNPAAATMKRALGSISLLLVVAFAVSGPGAGLEAAAAFHSHHLDSVVRCVADVNVRREQRQARVQTERPARSTPSLARARRTQASEPVVAMVGVGPEPLLEHLTDTPPPVRAL
jgi:hypothetical protein